MILGVTGNIGAGKSYVCNVFLRLGVPVYNSDDRSRLLLSENSDVRKKVISLLGEESFTSEGPDRAYIASRVFSDKELLNQLNGILHPAVAVDFEEWHSSNKNEPYCIKEAAILIESGSYKQTDKILLVTADIETRIQRVLDRDGVTRDSVEKRMNNQMSQEEKLAYADFIVSNNENDKLLPQILAVHKEMTQ